MSGVNHLSESPKRACLANIMRGSERQPTGFSLPSRLHMGDFPGGPVVKNQACNAGDISSIPRGELSPHATREELARPN